HGFLIVTVSSGITAALPGLFNNPGSLATTLAQKLPEASTFFLACAILRGLTGNARMPLQAVPLILCPVKLYTLGRRVGEGEEDAKQQLQPFRALSTPPSIYNLKYTLRNAACGTLFPAMSLIAVIVITLYIQRIFMTVLFFHTRDRIDMSSAIPQGALMVVLIIVTIPLIHPLTLTLAPKSYGMPRESHSQIGEEVRDEDQLNESNLGRQSSDTPGKRTLKTNGANRNLTPEQQVKFDRLEQEQAENERYVHMEPKNEEYGKKVGEAGKRNGGPEDFTHPAAIEPQQVVWLPHDWLGFAQAEEAEMDEKGDVKLAGRPPEG
ncbi:hypothetical protein FRC07_011403, partial [Ceratobasidium sp. 392]